ncbi:helix-turn-helix domain-containing protein [Modicisalibacter luteus]|uniref:Helix-turn-helix domain-containing protein n=1 Tax=Modicisalibacter luteus TaxID=453962 RepID=A0ABV7LYU1_9GAMM|nr:helix-turn-helix domain-containing protein [Halomonas lutea]
MELVQVRTSPQSSQYPVSELSGFPASNALRSVFRALPVLRRKQVLVKQGELFQGLYIVHCGMLKQSYWDKECGHQITHFFLPGDVIGLDAIEGRRYLGKVTALETVSLVQIPFTRLEKFPGLQEDHRQLLCYLSRTMQRELTRMWHMMSQPSDVRLARFLLSMSAGFQAQGFSPYCFRLPMTRGEIANYLYMADETISRLIGRLQKMNVLSVQGREFCIQNMHGLNSIAETSP